MKKKYVKFASNIKCYGAVVIAKTNYSEADLIVNFLTRELGLISGIAKYARKSLKRFGGGLLTPGTAAWYYLNFKPNQNMVMVTNAEINFKAPILPNDPITQALAAWALELVRAFETENSPAFESFNLLLKYFAALGKAENSIQARLISLDFTLKYLSLAGFAPHLDSCLICGKKTNSVENWLWEASAGGLYCGLCLNHISSRGLVQLSENLLMCLCEKNNFFTGNFALNSLQDINCVEDFFEKLAEYNRGYSFKSLKVLRQLI